MDNAQQNMRRRAFYGFSEQFVTRSEIVGLHSFRPMCYKVQHQFEEKTMTTVNVRKQGGAAVVTIPANMLKMMHIDVGSTLELNVSEGVLTARPTNVKRRYSLEELLQGVTPKLMAQMNADTAWARDITPIGREIL
jgi:antitoxin ChpS